MATKDRLKEFLSIQKIGRNKFEEQLGIATGYMSSKAMTITSDVIEKVTSAYPELNLDWLITGNGSMLRKNNLAIIPQGRTKPRIPLTAAAGALSYEERGVTLKECEQMPIVNQFPSYDFTMFIKGDSMSPKYESGDEIACRWVNEKRFIQWGKVHVLDTTQGIIVKKVYEDGDKIRCVSINPDYPPFSVPKDDIHSMSLVVGSLSIIEM